MFRSELLNPGVGGGGGLGELLPEAVIELRVETRRQGAEAANQRLGGGGEGSAPAARPTGVRDDELLPQPLFHLADLAPGDPKVHSLAGRSRADAPGAADGLQKRHAPPGKYYLTANLDPDVEAELHHL